MTNRLPDNCFRWLGHFYLPWLKYFLVPGRRKNRHLSREPVALRYSGLVSGACSRPGWVRICLYRLFRGLHNRKVREYRNWPDLKKQPI